MEKAVFVYVDLAGVPHLVGRLWARVRKNKEGASFEYNKAWLDESLLTGASPKARARTISHRSRYANVWRYRRLGT